MGMRTLVAFAGLVLGAIAPLALVTPADAAGETCNGLPATCLLYTSDAADE